MAKDSFYIRQALKFASGALTKGKVDIQTPAGDSLVIGNPSAERTGHWHIKSDKAVRRIFSRGALGFAEGYMAGEWDSNDLPLLLYIFADNFDRLVDGETKGTRWAALLTRFQHFMNRNTKRGSRKNILAHYDIGNTFYDLWLDDSWTYSSALWDEDKNASLVDAQHRKYRRICQELAIKPGDKVLEIGCGWGGFAEIAASEFGAHVTGLTISDEQLAFAKERMKRQNLSDKTDLRLQDYRDTNDQYDAIVSIEMFEAVGREYWDTYFEVLHRCLKPGGKACLQIITIDEDHFDSYNSGGVDFIQKYIFPGGMLPTVSHLKTLTQEHGLGWSGSKMFGLDYARTLHLWAESFSAAWGQIEPLGFDERFKRMWLYYLAYCEAGYRSGRIDVGQFTLSKPAK